MFFVHDRGRMLSVYISGQQLGAILGLITGGKIADTVGWRWGEYIVAIIGAVVLLLFIFSFEETLFPRFLFSSEVPVIIGRTSQDSDESTRELHNGKTAKGGDIASTAPLGNENDSSNAPQAQPDSYWTSSDKFPKRSYAELLKLWTYYPQNRTTFWQYFRRPFLLATFPNIIIAGFIFAFGSTAGIVSFNTISEILTAPPYNWSTTKTGLSFLAAVIGNIIGWALGALSDHLVIHIARRNGGVKEPEMRLYVLSISVILVPLGYLLYGFGAQSHLPWPTITLGILCMTAHQVLACTVATAYAMECFPGVSASLVTLLAIYSSVINFGVSYSVQPIIEGVGYGWTFFIFGILVLGAMGAAGWAVVRGKEWRRRCAGRYYGILGEVGDGEGGGVR
ncbi:MAG: hypothetical protein M1834_003258 [Cirrosporium novae-zelandiae]|nr:MAG: hypothetical protein M1834_003258 [Cirrosporium novae-zelandiae]